MDLRTFDLNLLRVFDALSRERSVTLAAQRLGISQPTVSASLNRLRGVLQDDLFVKTSKGVEPTPLARELDDVVAEILATVQGAVLNHANFKAATTERSFVVIAGQFGQLVLVDRVLMKFRALAPKARMRFIHPDENERAAVLEDGRADLAMGYFPQFARGNLFQQRLYARPFVCVARVGHPALADGVPSADAFGRLEHVVVAALSKFDEIIDAGFRRQAMPRRVGVELAYSAGAGHVLANSDLIAVVPEVLAGIYCRSGRLQQWPVPFHLPPYEVKQYWHRTVNKDPAVSWLRALIASELQVDPALPPQEPAPTDSEPMPWDGF